MLAVCAVAALVDVAMVWRLRDEWTFPSGALLTGMIVALVLSPHERLPVVMITPRATCSDLKDVSDLKKDM